MKRDKKWWRGLSPEDRSDLVRMERAGWDNHYHRGETGKCNFCGEPMMVVGFRRLCFDCGQNLLAIIRKADAAWWRRGP